MKTIQIIFYLSLFIAGLFQPLVWLALLAIVILNQDFDTKSHNQSRLKTPVSYTDTQDTSIDLNYYRSYKKHYLASPQWKAIKASILSRDQYTCQSCLVTGFPLEVHHIAYVNFMAEQPSDLISLCRRCHQEIHNKHGYDYNSTFPI